MLIMAGINLQEFVAASLLRPVSYYAKPTKQSFKNSSTEENNNSKIINLKLQVGTKKDNISGSKDKTTEKIINEHEQGQNCYDEVVPFLSSSLPVTSFLKNDLESSSGYNEHYNSENKNDSKDITGVTPINSSGNIVLESIKNAENTRRNRQDDVPARHEKQQIHCNCLSASQLELLSMERKSTQTNVVPLPDIETKSKPIYIGIQNETAKTEASRFEKRVDYTRQWSQPMNTNISFENHKANMKARGRSRTVSCPSDDANNVSHKDGYKLKVKSHFSTPSKELVSSLSVSIVNVCGSAVNVSHVNVLTGKLEFTIKYFETFCLKKKKNFLFGNMDIIP